MKLTHASQNEATILDQDQNKESIQAFHLVLYQPEIPPNTGAIQRVCAATGAVLHLVGPLGFRLDERSLRRAGMDYRAWVEVRRYVDWPAYVSTRPTGRLFAVSTRGTTLYTGFDYQPGDRFLFGPESRGLPGELLQAQADRVIRLPMLPDRRSLNLAVAASLVLYEALRQNRFPGLV